MRSFVLLCIVLLFIGGPIFIGFGIYLRTLEIGLGGAACILLGAVLAWRRRTMA